MINYSYKNYTSDDFNRFLDETQEVGYVEAYNPPIIYVKGLPSVRPKEAVLFENGVIGQVMTLAADSVQILSLSHDPPIMGERVCKTGATIEIGLGNHLFGQVVDPLGKSLYQNVEPVKPDVYKSIDPKPVGIERRVKINQFFETGVAVIDMLVPLGKGQRELVIGDRKTGKTEFALQTMLNQAKSGTICVYAGIGKNTIELKKVEKFIETHGIKDKCIVVTSYSFDPSAVVYLTPYSAMTVAEYFVEKGNDVLLILDDMTDHAKYYRELSLVAKKFPGRSAYPGDIFYAHSKLLERAGYFKTQNGINSITCLPVAESVGGDITGYIQTNLMSITDGHIFFDQEIFLQGRRPPVNYFLSVTRVGRQTQTKLKWSVGRELNTFLALLEKTQSFVHFGAEINEGIKTTLAMGDRLLYGLFNQASGEVLSMNLQLILFTLIWGQLLKETDKKSIVEQKKEIVNKYNTNEGYRKKVDEAISSCEDLNKLLGVVSVRQSDFI